MTFEAIGNPLFDGERTYTWGAGRQLRHISMPASGSSGSLSITNGFDADSQTMLQIVRASDAVLEAHVLRGNREITDERPASAFNWTRSSGDATADATWNNAHRSMKQITLTTAEINGNMQFSCSYTETQGNYGTVQVNNSLVASHTPATADANDVFVIENGMLKVTTSTANGTDYALNASMLSVNNGFTGTLTSTATFSDEAQTREIDFIYDHNGMRTAKIVSENGRVEMTEYTLHGKFITHMTKRTVDENGEESTEELHFFYDVQSRPAFVEYEGAMYRYIHNLQGDIVAIVDAGRNPVVEYKYNAWGKLLSAVGTLADTLGKRNPFRYRGYVYDEETGQYYLRKRYFEPIKVRFINGDKKMQTGIFIGCNMFAYSLNNLVNMLDANGTDAIWIQERESAAGFGHSGMMVQDSNGDWYYFFWGPQTESFSKEVVTGAQLVCVVEIIDTDGQDLSDINSVMRVLQNMGERAPIASARASKITAVYYFEGDYTKSYEKICSYETSNEIYQLLTNNCVQKTLEAFMESDKRFWDVGYGFANSLIPNCVAEKVALLPRKKSNFPWKLWLYNLLLE